MSGSPRGARLRSASPPPKRGKAAAAAAKPAVAASPAAAKASKAGPGFLGRHGNVYLYVPNLIGYARVLLTGAAIVYAQEPPSLSLILYLLAFICDELDGRFARKFNQTSTFGAVLDMVTDRLATTGLCMVLAVRYPSRYLFFVTCVALDIGAHWVQMYASLLSKASSHKDVSAATNPLLRLYYGNRLFMGVLCVGSEVFYLATYLISEPAFRNNQRVAATPRVAVALTRSLPAPVDGPNLSVWELFLLLAALPWALKQVTNVLQLQFSVQRLVAHDKK